MLNGQKTWTTYAQYADWIFVLARTDARRQEAGGHPFLLADVEHARHHGEAVPHHRRHRRLLRDLVRERARAAENLVGPENGGWTMAKALLGHERTLIGGIAEIGAWLQRCKRIAREHAGRRRPLLDDPGFRDRIARLEMRLRALDDGEPAHARRRAARPRAGRRELDPEDRRHRAPPGGDRARMDAMGHDALGWFDVAAATRCPSTSAGSRRSSTTCAPRRSTAARTRSRTTSSPSRSCACRRCERTP